MVNNPQYKSGAELSPRSASIWWAVQVIVWLAGFTIFLCLIFYPSLGLLLFWNILIPVAPALLVVSTGLWRNICPLATTNLLPRHLGLSKKRIMPAKTQAQLQLAAIVALFAIVPMRHVLFNINGPATALLLSAATATGIAMGFVYDWKSGWCSSLCPVSPVEKLYGNNTLISLPNAHCGQCVKCTVPCPDSTRNFNPAIDQRTVYSKLTGTLTIGGLPGFIWGWFHVPDNKSAMVTFHNLFEAYAIPFSGLAVTIILYLTLDAFVKRKNKHRLISIFAAMGVSCYYWYRIPALLGFGKFADDGLLLDLKSTLPQWGISAATIAVTLFFFWWLVFRKPNHQSWLVRPKYAAKRRPAFSQQ